MRVLTDKQQKQRQRTLEWQVRGRWLMTSLWSFGIATEIAAIIFDKRLQWPLLLKYSLWVSISFAHSVLVNIFWAVVFFVILVQWWLRVYNYRRDMLLTEQVALQKVAKPPECIWPPPPTN